MPFGCRPDWQKPQAMATELLDDVASVLTDAIGAYGDDPVVPSLVAARERLDEPLRVAIAGRVKAGKSTLLNALVGDDVAATDAGECTRVVTWYSEGVAHRAWLDGFDGSSRQIPMTRVGGGTELDLGGTAADDIDRLRVEVPSPQLRDITLIDTPGIASLSEQVVERTHRFLGTDADGGAPQADAVIYLLRHLHDADVGFLEAFQDDHFGRSSPVNTIAVLSRADEIGPGRTDSVDLAGRIASRYEGDARIRRLAQRVMPVAGLLAQAASTVGDEDFAALATLAAEPSGVTERLLSSTDRFVHSDDAAGVERSVRWSLLERLGVFGIKYSIALLHHDRVQQTDDLTTALVGVSGLAALRQLLVTQFADRSDALRAKSSLDLLENTLKDTPVSGTNQLKREIERIRVNAHALAEIQLLNQLRLSTSLAVADRDRVEMERLLGGHGNDSATRLGLDGAPDAQALRQAGLDAVTRWTTYRELPTSSPDQRRAAGVAIRSAERLVARATRES